MVQFERLDIRNFLSFRKAEFYFQGHDFLLILGENLDSESSSSNGAGKSALLEALVWVLFGRTLRNLAFDEVVNNRTRSNCCVRLLFSENGNRFLVERFRKSPVFGNALELHLNDQRITKASNRETQESLEKVLGMNFEIFMNSIAFPQGSARFFAILTDLEQKAILEKMLNLETLSAAQERVKSALRELDSSADQCRMELSTLQARQETLRSQVNELKQSHTAYEEERRQKIHELIQEIRSQKKRAEELGSFKAGILRQRHGLKAKLASLSSELEALPGKENLAKQHQSAIFKAEAEIERLQKEKRIIREKLDRLSSLEGRANCPTCGQSVTGELVTEQRKGLDSEWEDNLLQLQSVAERRDGERLKLRELETGINELLRKELEMKDLDDRLGSLEKQLWDYEKSVSLVEERVGQLREQAYGLKSEANPYLKDLDKLKASLEKLDWKIGQQEDQGKKLALEQKYLEFWEQGFSNAGLKSFILDSVVPVLNKVTNDYLNVLTDGTIQLGFHTQVELKSGEFREKFGVDVVAEDQEVKFEGLSGGEKRRVNLAILMALKHLSSMQAGGQCNLLLADELFDSLDPEGIERAIELLRRQVQEGIAVFMISHDETMQEYFQDVLTVRRQNGISEILSEAKQW